MKCTYGTINENCKIVLGVINLDNNDITDLNIKNAIPDTIYFYNIINKLTETGIAKLRNKGFYYNKYNGTYNNGFINILPDSKLTEVQKKFKNKKDFMDIYNNEHIIYNTAITNELLEKNDWEYDKNTSDLLKTDVYKKYIPGEGNLVLTYDYSNMQDRDWALHVDNTSFETIGSADIQTTEHFNTMMSLLNINYKL